MNLRWVTSIALMILLSSSLTACGQKGSLILPPPADAQPKPIKPQTLIEPETEEPESERAPLGILPGSLPTLP